MLGGAAGAVVTAAIWVSLGVQPVAAIVAVAVGTMLGAAVGLFTGEGVVQEAWSGWLGALIIPVVVLGLFNVVVIAVLATHGH